MTIEQKLTSEDLVSTIDELWLTIEADRKRLAIVKVAERDTFWTLTARNTLANDQFRNRLIKEYHKRNNAN